MYDLLIFHQGLAPLCSCQKMSSVRLSALFLLLFLISTQILKCSQESGHKYVAWSPFVSCLRKCKHKPGSEYPA